MNSYDFIKSLLTTIPQESRNISLLGFVAIIVISIVLALLVSSLYIKFFDANTTGSRIHRSFPLLAPAVTTIFITVQFSLPLSLGLLGALSIVRFRTPIKEPEEIGFILVVIACSISIATFNVAFAAILIAILFAMLSLLKFYPGMHPSVAHGIVLNLLIDTPQSGTEEALKTLSLISEKLQQHKIRYNISSVHVDNGKTNASIVLKNNKNNDFSFISTISDEFPGVIIDYYQR